MNYFYLDEDEKKLLEDVEKGNFVSVKSISKEKLAAVAAARNVLNKTKNINIRLSIRDVQKLKARALESGLAYQTLAAAILRQYATRKIEVKL